MRLDPYVRLSLIVLVGCLLVLAFLTWGCQGRDVRKVASTTEVFYSSSSGSWDGTGGFKGGGDVVRGVMDGDADSHTVGVSLRPLAAIYDENAETRDALLAMASAFRQSQQPPPAVIPAPNVLPEENEVGCLMGMTPAARERHNALKAQAMVDLAVQPHDDTTQDTPVESSQWWELALKIAVPVAVAAIGATLEVKRRRKRKRTAEETNPVR